MILNDMASALSFLHASDIVHCDIQLMNILFHPVRGAVLANFGMSFELGSNPIGNGLPWYLPPEFLEPADAPGTATDMWALGVVMLWALGKIPMPESTKHWVAEHVRPTGSTTRATNKKAEHRMEDWLAIVRAGNHELQEEGGEITGLIDGLVREEKQERIDAAKLMEELAKCNLKD